MRMSYRFWGRTFSGSDRVLSIRGTAASGRKTWLRLLRELYREGGREREGGSFVEHGNGKGSQSSSMCGEY